MVKLGSPRSARGRARARVALLYALCGSALANPLTGLLTNLLTVRSASAEPARAEPAPIEAALIIGAPARLDAIAGRLAGHRVRRGDHVLIVEDVAGAGRPWVGVVASRCGALWLDTAVHSFLLGGPLARPRVAGPGYLVWAVGAIGPGAATAPRTLELQRLGVLARPAELPPASPPAGAPAGARRCPPVPDRP